MTIITLGERNHPEYSWCTIKGTTIETVCAEIPVAANLMGEEDSLLIHTLWQWEGRDTKTLRINFGHFTAELPLLNRYGDDIRFSVTIKNHHALDHQIASKHKNVLIPVMPGDEDEWRIGRSIYVDTTEPQNVTITAQSCDVHSLTHLRAFSVELHKAES